MYNITFRSYQKPNFVFNNKYINMQCDKTSKNKLEKDIIEFSFQPQKEKFDYSIDDGKISFVDKIKTFCNIFVMFL